MFIIIEAMRGYYDTFMKTCAKYPSRIAVRHYENGVYKCYTYSELYGVCEYISQHLQQLKCNKGVIALVADRNIAIPCVIAAAHKCCTTFMFLQPSQDLENLPKDIEFTTLITINSTGSTAYIDTKKKPDRSIKVFDLVIDFYNCKMPESNNSLLAQHSFIAMTSGSTGEPKHIQVPIQCLQPNVDDLTKMFKICPEDIIYFSTPLTFDPSMIEILLACMNGASLLIAPPRVDILFPDNQPHSITFWQTTPSRFFQHSNADIRDKILSAKSTLKTLALGGEPLHSVSRLKELKERENKTKIYVLYGVTEMSCWACAVELDLNKTHSDREIPLGQCLSETQMIVNTKENKNTGKIVLVSKTRQCIILNQSSSNETSNSLKFVDTGDIGEVRNGTIYFRGRKDDVVKRFGHKVNLEMIEGTVMQCPRVKTCSCIWLPKPSLLVLYFTSEQITTQELYDFLKCKLEDKYWPDKLVRVNSLPTNPHGKISRQLVLKMHETKQDEVVPNELLAINFLKELNAILSSNFTYEQIKNKNFFFIGGTSFRAIAFCNRISMTYPNLGQTILPYLVSQNITMEEILKILEKELSMGDGKPKRLMKRPRSGSVSPKKVNTVATSPVPRMDFILLWTYDTGKCVDASPTLFLKGTKAFVTVGSHSGKVVVAEEETGNVQAVLSLSSRIEASVLCHIDSKMSVGIVGAYDGTLCCFSLEGYSEVWRVNVGAMIKSKAVSCRGLVYVASYDGRITCLDIQTGQIKNVINVADQAISADLVLAKDQYILIGSLSGMCGCVDTVTNSLNWGSRLSSPIFANPVLYDEHKYVVYAEVNGEIHCMTVEKGIKVWRYQGAKGNIFSSIFVKHIDKQKWQMIFGCHDNKVYSIKIKNFQPSLQWKALLTSPIYSTPCVLSESLVLAVSNNGKLVVLEVNNGAIVTEYFLPSECFSSPVVLHDHIFIGCRDDNLYAIKYLTSVIPY